MAVSAARRLRAEMSAYLRDEHQTAAARQARLLGRPIPGLLSPAELVADELTRRPIPNRADRRRNR